MGTTRQPPTNLARGRRPRQSAAPESPAEARRLLSHSVLSGGTLTVTGTSGADTITVYRTNNAQGDNLYVRFETVPAHIDGPFSASTVTKVVINANAGGDVVKIEDTDDVGAGGTFGSHAVAEVTEINGGSGVDTINGGDLADTVNGGDDGDTINGRRGNDKLIGYGGDDTLDGGDGSDTIFGGLEDYSGNEVGYGSDSLTGGPGVDYMYGGGDNDTFWAGGDTSGADYLDGGTGTDVVNSSDGDETLVRIP